MKPPVLVAGGLALLLIGACASKPETITRIEQPEPAERDHRANDPYGQLTASEVYVQKGVRYMEAGNYEQALRDMQRAVDLDDDNSDAYNALAVLYQRLDRPDDAQENFRRALRIKSENYGARNNFGRFLCAQGKYNEGMEQFRSVIGSKLYEQQWMPLTNAGVCAHSAGRNAEAEQFLRQALSLNPGFPPALFELAKLSLETGQAMSARGFLERYHAAIGPTSESLMLGVDIERALGNSQGAESYARTLNQSFPDSVEAAQARRRFSLY